MVYKKNVILNITLIKEIIRKLYQTQTFLTYIRAWNTRTHKDNCYPHQTKAKTISSKTFFCFRRLWSGIMWGEDPWVLYTCVISQYSTEFNVKFLPELQTWHLANFHIHLLYLAVMRHSAQYSEFCPPTSVQLSFLRSF